MKEMSFFFAFSYNKWGGGKGDSDLGSSREK